MKKTCLIPILFACFAFSSCAPTLHPNSEVSFLVPSKLSALKKGSVLAIVSRSGPNFGYQRSSELINHIASQINSTKYCSASAVAGPDRLGEFTHVMNIDNFMVHRADSRDEAAYNKRIAVEKKVRTDKDGNEVGGHEVIVETDGKSACATLVTAVTIYEASEMEPLAYFNIMSTESEWKKINEPESGAEAFEKALSQKIVERIKALTTWHTSKVGVILPSKCDEAAKNLLISGRLKEAMVRAKGLLPEANLFRRTPAEVDAQYAKWQKEAEEAKKANVQGVVKRDKATDLSNYYLYILSMESMELSQNTLRAAFEGYTRILSHTDESSLVQACAHSLGRVEAYAQRVNPSILEDIDLFAGNYSHEPAVKKQVSAPPPRPPEATAPKQEGNFVLAGELSKQKPTIAHVLRAYGKSSKDVNRILKKNESQYPEKVLRRLPVGTKIYLSEDGTLKIEKGK